MIDWPKAPVQQPTPLAPIAKQPALPSPPSKWFQAIQVVALGVGLFFFVQAKPWERIEWKGQQQVAPAPVSVEGSTIVFVYDTTHPTVDQVKVFTGIQDWVKTNKLAGFLRVDQGESAAKPYLDFAGDKQPTPFAIRTDAKGKPVVVKPFPKLSNRDDLLK